MAGSTAIITVVKFVTF